MEKDRGKLSRSIGFWLLLFYGLGNILGAGIYVLIGKIAGIAGYYTPLAFLLAFVVVVFTALAYVELSGRFPRSAGSAIYIYEGFRCRWLATCFGLLIGLSGLFSAATMMHGFYGYLSGFFVLPRNFIIILLIAILTAIAVWGITESLLVTAFITMLEAGGLLMVIAVGLPFVEFEPEKISRYFTNIDPNIANNILLASFLALFAFIGFEDMVNIVEEVKEPERNMGRAILYSLFLAATFYFLVALVSVTVVEPQVLAESESPLSTVYTISTGKPATVLSIIALFAIINGALVQMIMASRILYGMASEGWLPAIFTKVHPKRRTPLPATLLVAVIVVVLALFLPILTLAKSTSFLVFTIFILVNLSLIKVKLRDPKPAKGMVYPVWVPAVGLVLNVAILTYQMLMA